jgi:hypothetical protein
MSEEPFIVIGLPYFHRDEYGTIRGGGGGGGGKGSNEREKQKIKKRWRRQIDEDRARNLTEQRKKRK